MYIYAQTHDYGFIQNNSIPVYNKKDSCLQYPWAGGMNNIQFAPIDLNFDGKKDLVAFEVQGRRILPFINKAKKQNEINYSPQYAHLFPEDIDGFLHLIDFNNDGKEDIFTYNNAGIKVYKNISDTILKFETFTEQITSIYYDTYINLFCTEGDYIVIKDMDNDGDVDILAFWSLGKYIDYHKNFSVEKYGDYQHLDFHLSERCWGYFSESSEGNGIMLNDNCENLSILKQHRHTGSTMLLFDEDGSGLNDLILGDMDYPNLVLLTNGGSSDSAHINSIDTLFPSYDNPVNLYSMPCPIYMDVDNDSVKDLIISPLDVSGFKSENTNSVWCYKNIGTNNKPIFQLQTKSFIQNQMLDFGSGAYPVLYDIDKDGLTDLFVGNYGYFDSAGKDNGILKCYYSASIAYFKNTGTKNTPIFTLITDNLCNLRTNNYLSLIPTFADINNDNKPDMMVGLSDGSIMYFQNTTTDTVISFALPILHYQNIDIGEYSSPQLFDIDNDSLIDLLIGTKEGKISYYKNNGTRTQANFSLISNSLGNVDVRDYDNSYFGYATPCFFRTRNNEIRLFVGAENGYVYYYKNIDNKLNSSFLLQDSMFYINDNMPFTIREGIRTFVTTSYLTNDSFPDLLIGNFAGGITHYKGKQPPSIYIGINDYGKHLNSINLLVYPNPTNDNITLLCNEMNIERFEIVDIFGRIIFEKTINSPNYTQDISFLKKGMYFIKNQMKNKQIINKKIIKK